MKTSILLISQLHDDSVPLQTAQNIAGICNENQVKTDIGFELFGNEISEIRNQIKIVELINQYKNEQDSTKKMEIKDKIQETPHFVSLEENLIKQQINLKDQFQKYIETDPYVTKSTELYKVNKAMIDLLENYPHFFCDKKIDALDSEFKDPFQDRAKLYAKYEEERIKNMVDAISQKVIESDGSSENHLILVANLGVNHVARLQEALKQTFSDSHPDLEIASVRILPDSKRNDSEEFDFARAVGDDKKLKEAIDTIPTLNHNGLNTDPREYDKVQKQINSLLERLGIKESVKIYIGDEKGPLVPPAIATARSSSSYSSVINNDNSSVTR